MQKHRSGFTLVELLVVISIIGVLVTLAFPSFNLAIRALNKSRAATMIANVKNALTMYNTEYGTWPHDPGSEGGTGPSTTMLSTVNAYPMLIGDPQQKLVGTPCANPHQTVYLEFKATDLDNPNPNLATKFVDPWKVRTVVNNTDPTNPQAFATSVTKRQDYYIEVDGNYTNQLGAVPDTSQTTAGMTTTINAGCAIWSLGPPVDGLPNTNPQNFITSW